MTVIFDQPAILPRRIHQKIFTPIVGAPRHPALADEKTDHFKRRAIQLSFCPQRQLRRVTLGLGFERF